MTLIAWLLIITVTPVVLWVTAELTATRPVFRILAGFFALVGTALIVHWATAFGPLHEQAQLRSSMPQLEETLRRGDTNLACQAIAAYNQAAKTGDSYRAVVQMSKTMERSR